ncbi:long-chain fatty acid--CoA ligase [Haematobacter missouriensis]|mgnify:CR=1 FL=1|uniref:3-methylmercaptopropionyl-CoA ligase n=1 Tax=Haematobacter missouriensis TaxID=366616 RepID=A0A212ALX4_9RHOB|nr:long-chain-fatty-acid--CoA ligase [Haematobacter missouriensis]KFI32958.1 long-chain fatty acid--CoA ligase [Haematobacter missouriensis]OWJ73197.1 long-chain fatty acid--CoA ligase [Haematobacter missouriensis]OWJ82487.1 long-chain fatty acid--CoA ligase [Haematobacter missouriensis]
MLGGMMYKPLLISSLIEHAARWHGDTEIVSVETTGGIDRSDWATVEANARRLASALEARGFERGDRIATLAWNNRRHLELYYGIAGAGMVCHTLNPRLPPDQLIYIMNHASDRLIFVDRTFLPLIAKVLPELQTLRGVVLMGPREEEAAAMIDGLLFHDDLVAEGDDDYTWPEFDELSPSSLCYTSGTTGNPKGVLYTHRSTVLHSYGANQPDGLALKGSDTVMPVVPMFHVNAWGVPYVAAAMGCKMALPGPGLDGESLVRLINAEEVTVALGVPTIWMGLLGALEKAGETSLSLQRTIVGGSALPPSMIKIFRDRYGVELIHAWGMTETSPIGSLNQLKQKHQHLSDAEKEAIRQGQGRPPFGVDLRVVDAEGHILPNDGEEQGQLQIRGHWIIQNYFGQEKSALTFDGWFDTGDIATLDADGYMIIRDRAKDIIKSGGEWISTVELENIAIAHPLVANAAAIAARHEKWDERPVLIVQKRPAVELTEAELLAFYEGKVAKWQVPDRVIFVESLPLGATGKVVKAKLRELYGDILLGQVA